MADTPEFLGQDLFRQALDESSLEPFEAPAAVMEDDQYDILVRANAFKALRFGLAGIGIHGWQDEITAQLDGPVELGGHYIGYRFDDDKHFPPHRHQVIEYGELDIPGDHVNLTQGEYALQSLKDGLRTSAEAFFSDMSHGIEGISMAAIHEAIQHYVLQGRRMRLDRVPDAVRRNAVTFDDFYDSDADFEPGQIDPEVPVASSLGRTAANNVRFGEMPVIAGMKHYADLYPDGWRPVPTQEQYDALNYDPDAAAGMLVRNVRFPVRLSQRQQGTRNLVDKETIEGDLGVMSVVADKNGVEEVTWPRKYAKPGRHKDIGLHMAEDGDIDYDWSTVNLVNAGTMALVQKRNKCPIGYTAEAGETMPGFKIADGILYHLHQAGLHDPKAFMLPREIYVALDK